MHVVCLAQQLSLYRVLAPPLLGFWSSHQAIARYLGQGQKDLKLSVANDALFVICQAR